MLTKEEIDRNFNESLKIRLNHEYRKGLNDGLNVARLIRNWLTRQPDRKWQKEVRQWADKEIKRAEKEITD